jgi:hypothetical protein
MKPELLLKFSFVPDPFYGPHGREHGHAGDMSAIS